MAQIGQRYARLTVIADTGKRTKDGKRIYLCGCDCGNTKEVASNQLGTRIKSCGCLYKETRQCRLIDDIPRHDQPLYNIWRAMKRRCYNKRQPNYKRYGAKGIRVCDEWKNDYAAFRDWAIANGYVHKNVERAQTLSIDRIDPCGNYEPTNCRFITVSENSKRRWA
ncbi:MAG: hypothetical protein NC184_05690 [Roseburia sp.]|nr:hypothetical protein [Ruminococcus flavefaciens]MCM1368280.1 hypothetical protein [Roseburia sp.]